MPQLSTDRALPRIGTTLGTAFAVLALTGAPAHAAGTVGASLTGEGLHISAGALVDPNGRTWVADHNGGFCRMTEATDAGPGHIDHPQHPGDAGPRTCLGGLLPDAGTGPDAAGQPVLVDPTPDWVGNGDEMALIPDGASPSSEVVRARWNPHTGLFEFVDTISMLGARGRPTSLSLGPDDAVYVGFQRETTIQRIVEPAAASAHVEIVGTTSDGRAVQLVAAGRDAAGNTAVYVAETTGIRVLHPVDGTVQRTEAADFAIDPLATPGAMFYDLAADKLYVGTANGTVQADAGIDDVIEIDPATGEVDPTFATGFSMVGGIGTAPNGHLYVVDDPALLDPAEPIGTGRLFHVGLPAAHVTAGPLDDAGNTGREATTADRTPAFAVAGDGAVQCLLRGPGTDTGWVACAANGTFTVPAALADGRYVLSVRATKDGVTGKPEAFRFTVDTVAPHAPVIVRPAGSAPVSASPWFEFRSEDGAAFECAFEESDTFEPCVPGRTRHYAEAGEHLLQIVAIDRAGNRSLPSGVARFTVDPDLTPETAPGWGAGPPSHKGSTLYTGGLHISAGALVDPNGRTWLADHNGGFCRVTEPGEDGAGVIDHPQLPGDPGPRTCLGGLLPEAGTGPDAAGQPALVDPTPNKPGSGDEMALIPDGAAPSSDVVRAQWNPDNGLFEYKDVVTMIGARIRPLAVSVGPDGAAYVVFQKSGTVQRIANPAADTPQVDVVGNLVGRRAAGIAVGRNAPAGQPGSRTVVFVAEDTGLTELEPNPDDVPTAQPSRFTVDVAASSISALAYDLKRDDLYVGMAAGTVAGVDSVHRFHVGGTAAEYDWVTGYSMIGGLFVRPDGVVYVLDDPALLDPAEPIGTGRMFHVGLPAAQVAANSPAFVNTARPRFTVTGEETVQCRLRGMGLDTGYVTCAGGSWTPAQDLADGSYLLTVRSIKPANAVTGAAAIVGLVEAHRFTVDRIAPGKPSITSPAQGELVGSAPWFTFDAEPSATFECAWDGSGTFTACVAGRTRSFDNNGDHTLRIRAIDSAGNRSVPSDTLAFSARGRIERIDITSGPSGATRNASPVFRFSTKAVNVEFACRLNSHAFTACTSGKAYQGLADGTYTFEVQGMDEVGNVAIASRQFRVDTSTPVVDAPALADGVVTGRDISFGVGLSEPAALRCTLDGGGSAPCGPTVVLTGLTAGDHTIAITATDAAGNVGTLTRRFTVVIPGAPSAPAAPTLPAPAAAVPAPVATPAAPAEPTVTVVDQTTGAPLTLRLADIDQRVDLARIQQAGVTVQVIPARGTKLIRFRIFKVAGGGRGRAVAAAAGGHRTIVATIYRHVRPGRNRITLTRRELRRVTAGHYVLEVTPGTSRKRLGQARTARFQVTR